MAQSRAVSPATSKELRWPAFPLGLRQELLLVAVVTIALVILALVPVIGTAFGSFWSTSIIRPGGRLTFDNWPRVLQSGSFLQALWNSVLRPWV